MQQKIESEARSNVKASIIAVQSRRQKMKTTVFNNNKKGGKQI